MTSDMRFQFVANDERDTERFGEALARVLPPGVVVALTGTLGAGKTRLVQAVAKAVGIDPSEVVSPTFVLVHEYQVRVQGSGIRVQGLDKVLPADQTLSHAPPGSRHATPVSVIYHMDAYRIRDDDEFRELGPEEYFESNGWTFIEWADRVAGCLPRDYLKIDIAVTGLTTRRFAVTAHGTTLNAASASLRAMLKPAEH